MSVISSEKIICPKCNKMRIIKYGWQEGKQIYFCKVCKKKFRTNRLRNKTYSPKVITNAITYYNLGNTLNETVKSINMRFKVKISKSSVHKWIKEFSNICTYWNLRPEVMKNFKIRSKTDIIESFSFKHSGLTYNFMYHKPKLNILCHRFNSLSKY